MNRTYPMTYERTFRICALLQRGRPVRVGAYLAAPRKRPKGRARSGEFALYGPAQETLLEGTAFDVAHYAVQLVGGFR